MAASAQSTGERRRFTADEVHRMAEIGILGEDDRIELLDGELVLMPPTNPPHVALTTELRERLVDAYRPDAFVREQSDVVLGKWDVPLPDLAVIRGRPRDYLRKHPNPSADIILVVEVSDSSRQRDRAKARLYARAGVRAYWILDIPARALHVHVQPDRRKEQYKRVTILGPKDDVKLPEMDHALNVGSMLCSNARAIDAN